MEREVRLNEFGAELIFKGGNLFAHSRLTDSTFLCDSGEAPFFNYSNEHLHCIEFVHGDLRIPLRNGFCAQESPFFRPIVRIKEYRPEELLYCYAFLLGIAAIPPECCICAL